MNFVKKLASKVDVNKAKNVASAVALAGTVGMAFCDPNIGKIFDLMFTLATIAGVFLIAMGVVQICRAVISISGGDQLQPGQLGKAIAMTFAGLCACLLKTILQTIGVTIPSKIV